MKTTCYILLCLMTFNVNAQSHHDSPFLYERLFASDTIVYRCGRPWMISKERMDNIVDHIKQLEDSLVQLHFVGNADTSVNYIKLFDAEFTYRIEAGGQTSQQFCVTDSVQGETINDSIILKGTMIHGQDLKLYNDIFLVISREHYYLGNCQFWTTWKTYSIREDEYLNYIKR